MENESKRREDERIGRLDEEQETTFRFPILDTSAILGEEVKMNNIPPYILPNFYGMAYEDPNSFLFEFDIYVVRMHILMIHIS